MDEKVCNQFNCEFAGQAQPIKNFGKSKCFMSSKNPEGINARCKSCSSMASKTNYQKRKSSAPAVTKRKLIIPKEKKKTAGNSHVSVLLDVSDYPELMEKISRKAHHDFRSVEYQILYDLHCMMGMEQ